MSIAHYPSKATYIQTQHYIHDGGTMQDVPVMKIDVNFRRMFAKHSSVDYRRQKVVADMRPRSNDAQFHCVACHSTPLGRLLL